MYNYNNVDDRSINDASKSGFHKNFKYVSVETPKYGH